MKRKTLYNILYWIPLMGILFLNSLFQWGFLEYWTHWLLLIGVIFIHSWYTCDWITNKVYKLVKRIY